MLTPKRSIELIFFILALGTTLVAFFCHQGHAAGNYGLLYYEGNEGTNILNQEIIA